MSGRPHGPTTGFIYKETDNQTSKGIYLKSLNLLTTEAGENSAVCTMFWFFSLNNTLPYPQNWISNLLNSGQISRTVLINGESYILSKTKITCIRPGRTRQTGRRHEVLCNSESLSCDLTSLKANSILGRISRQKRLNWVAFCRILSRSDESTSSTPCPVLLTRQNVHPRTGAGREGAGNQAGTWGFAHMDDKIVHLGQYAF